MIVVSNASPIMNLAVIGQLDIMRSLYGNVLMPEAVSRELSAIGIKQPGVATIQTLPWLKPVPLGNSVVADTLLLELDRGEAEAIALAIERKADLLILGERRGRKVASRLGLKFVGLLGLLAEAKRKGLIVKLKPLLDDLIVKAGFWVNPELYDRVLREVDEWNSHSLKRREAKP